MCPVYSSLMNRARRNPFGDGFFHQELPGVPSLVKLSERYCARVGVRPIQLPPASSKTSSRSLDTQISRLPDMAHGNVRNVKPPGTDFNNIHYGTPGLKPFNVASRARISNMTSASLTESIQQSTNFLHLLIINAYLILTMSNLPGETIYLE